MTAAFPAYVYSVVNLHRAGPDLKIQHDWIIHIGSRAMAQEPELEPERAWPQHVVESDSASNGSWIYACACHGIPPIAIESPLHFFGIQLVAGLGSTLTLLLVEMLR
jgi:hypothetical protein